MRTLRRITPLLVLLLVLPLTALSSTLTVTFFDVGQADAALVTCDGQSLLVDAGTNKGAAELVSMLRAEGVERIDYAVGSHPHEDHIGGLDAVIDAFDVRALWMPRASHNTKTFEDVLLAVQRKGLRVTSPAVDATYPLGDALITILAPNSQEYSNLNNHSIVLRVDHGENSLLFAADAETLSEEEMLVAGARLDADILKVGHHGSSTSSSEAFLLAVDPDYGIISCGASNDYGHPHREVVEALANLGVVILRTDELGSISFASDGTTWARGKELAAQPEQAAQMAYGMTGADDVNIRSAASVEADKVGSVARAGTPLRITGETTGADGKIWYAVDTGEHTGYIRGDFVAEISEAEYALLSAKSGNESEAAQVQYIGNKSSKKFHRPTCSSLPAEKNRVYFDARGGAIEAGYAPCQNCNP